MPEDTTTVAATEYQSWWDEFCDSVENVADSVWDKIVGAFSKGASLAAAVLKKATEYFVDNIDDALIAAATKGVSAAESATGDWTDKLSAAVSATIEELGTEAESYAKTAVIKAVQDVYAASKVTTSPTDSTSSTDASSSTTSTESATSTSA